MEPSEKKSDASETGSDELTHGHRHLFFPEDVIQPTARDERREKLQKLRRPLAIAAFVILLVGAVGGLLMIGPALILDIPKGTSAADRFKAISDARASILQALGGIAVLGGLYFTARTVALNSAGQVTDRFAKTVEQLGNSAINVRIGGLYSLEFVARDSAIYRPVVTDIVLNFISINTNHVAGKDVSIGQDPISRDVQVALGILGRRLGVEKETRLLNLWGLNLNKSDLTMANLRRVNACYASFDQTFFDRSDLSDGVFAGARIRNSSLGGANCKGASFVDANLTGTYATGGDFTGADFSDADLTGVDFSGRDHPGHQIDAARVSGADFTHADLTGANLSGVDLREVRGLKQDQIDAATIDGKTRLPDGLSPRATRRAKSD